MIHPHIAEIIALRQAGQTLQNYTDALGESSM